MVECVRPSRWFGYRVARYVDHSLLRSVTSCKLMWLIWYKSLHFGKIGHTSFEQIANFRHLCTINFWCERGTHEHDLRTRFRSQSADGELCPHTGVGISNRSPSHTHTSIVKINNWLSLLANFLSYKLEVTRLWLWRPGAVRHWIRLSVCATQVWLVFYTHFQDSNLTASGRTTLGNHANWKMNDYTWCWMSSH